MGPTSEDAAEYLKISSDFRGVLTWKLRPLKPKNRFFRPTRRPEIGRFWTEPRSDFAGGLMYSVPVFALLASGRPR